MKTIDPKLVAEIRKRRDANQGYEQSNAFPFLALQEYGAIGYAVAAYGPDEGEDYYNYANLPADCPFPGGLTTDALIDHIWAPIAPEIPKFVGALKVACKQVVVLHKTSDAKHPNNKGWFLGYFLDRKATAAEGSGRYSEIWGRQAFKHPRLGRAVRKTGFKLPASLRLFYNVHNGLGLSSPRTYGVEAIYSARNLKRLPNQPLIDIYCDSGGNRATFSLSGEDRLVDWDRQTHETARIGPLWKLFEESILRYVTGDY